jgi:hypothetical protein
VLVGSGLAWRRLPPGTLLKLALIWIVIFGVIAGGAAYWSSCCAAPG